MIVISDTSPLIHLAACNHLHLLQTLYGQIVIPVSVDEEIRLKCKERKGRITAKQFHLKTGGVLSVLIEAKRQKLIAMVIPLIEQMVLLTGFRISDDLLNEIKKIVGE